MEPIQLLILVVLLILLAEVSYLVTKLPRQSGSKKKYIFVDTSVLIDGRIVAVAQSGFIGGTLAIPRSVIGELQFLADHADAEKRARARHGLDVANELQKLEGVDVVLFQDGSKAEEGVDERLLVLAKRYSGSICTIDYNLNKVAVVEGIAVCNVNELAKNLRMAYLPGEKMILEIVQKGQDSHQGVGYLPDGTMVVVEQASAQVGQGVEVEFIRSLQTAAGKMMFAKKVQSSSNNTSGKQQPPKQRAVVQQVKNAKVVGKKPVTPSNSQQQNSQQPKPQQNRKPQANATRTQRRRSVDREASLLELVDKQ